MTSVDPVVAAGRLRQPGAESAADLLAMRDRFLGRIVLEFLGLGELVRERKADLFVASGLGDLFNAATASWDAMLDVASDPSFCFWVQTLQDAVVARSEGRVARNDIDRIIAASGIAPDRFAAAHVAEFGAFVAAASQRAGASLNLKEPLAIPGGMLPYSGTELDAIESVLIGVHEGKVIWREDAPELPVPTAEVPGWTLRLHAHGLAFGLRHVERWDRLAGYEQRVAAARNLTAGMRLLDETLADFCRHAGLCSDTCIPMTTDGVTPMASGSYTRLQGAIFIADSTDPYLTAEMLVHEVSHTRLSLLEDLAPFFGGFSRNEQGHYSPWRDSLRSAEGVLHALFVHIEIAHFWSERLTSSNDSALRDRCLRRLWTLLEQLKVGSDHLWRSGNFTEVGRILLERIDADRQIIATRVPPLAEAALPFFSELKTDPGLAKQPIASAIAAHRDGVYAGLYASKSSRV